MNKSKIEEKEMKTRISRGKFSKEGSNSNLKKNSKEAHKKERKISTDINDSTDVIGGNGTNSGPSSTLPSGGDDNLGWKPIRPRTLKRGSTIADVERAGTISGTAGIFNCPEERARSETLCIEAGRINAKYSFLRHRISSFKEDHKRLLQERDDLRQKREALFEKMKEHENERSPQFIAKMHTQFDLMLTNLCATNKILKERADELRTKCETETLPPLEDILTLSQLARIFEPILSCPPIEQYENTLIEEEIQNLKDFNYELEKKLERIQERNSSKGLSDGITTILETLEQLKAPLTANDQAALVPLIESLEGSSCQVIERMTNPNFVNAQPNSTTNNSSSNPSLSSNSSLSSSNSSSGSSSSLTAVLPKRKDVNEELYLVSISSIDASNDTLDGNGIRFSEKKEGEEYPQIKAATVNRLVERLTYQKYPDMGFQKAFLLTYRSFMTPLDLLEKLILRFCISPAGDGTAQELELFRKYVQTPIQLRVTNVLRNWIENHWPDFDEDLKRLFLSFVENTVTSVNPKLATSLSQSFMKKEQNAASKTIQRILKEPPTPILPKNLSSFSFDDLDAIELARQLTLLEHKLYKAIEPKELLHQAWSKKDKEKRSPNVLSMIRMFNKISNWVCSEIVGTTDLPSRATKLRKFIDIAKECYRINNYNGTLEIVAALGNSAVFRLKKTWEEETVKPALEDLESMKQLMEVNYRKFRDELHRANPPCIPYIGIFLTDLTFTEDGMPNTLEGSLINFAKLRQVAEKIQEIQQYQNDSYNFTEVAEIQVYLNEIQEADDDTLYKLSQKIESKKLNKFFG